MIESLIPGWMTNKELTWLWETAQVMDSVLEVGSWKGRSTVALGSGCPTIIAVDHFLGTELSRETTHKEAKEGHIADEFWKNTRHIPNLGVMRMDSVLAAQFIKDKSIDMVFIDGDHTYPAVKRDTELWLPKAKKIICGHDYNSECKKAVNEIFQNVTNPVDSIWCVCL